MTVLDKIKEFRSAVGKILEEIPDARYYFLIFDDGKPCTTQTNFVCDEKKCSKDLAESVRNRIDKLEEDFFNSELK